jgi:hypothetical protein
MDCPGPGRDERLSTLLRSCDSPTETGTGICLEETELDIEGTGEASRAIEACLTESGAGDRERCAEVAIGDDPSLGVDEPSPLSYLPGDAILRTKRVYKTTDRNKRDKPRSCFVERSEALAE